MKTDKKVLILLSIVMAAGAHAESGYDAWLRYATLNGAAAGLPAAVTMEGNSIVMETRRERVRGAGWRRRRWRARYSGDRTADREDRRGWYSLSWAGTNPVIAGVNDRRRAGGVRAAQDCGGESIAKLGEAQTARRAVGQWDNLDGTIERGYGAPRSSWRICTRVKIWGGSAIRRMSPGSGHACSINNVNANPRVLASDFVPEIERIAEAFRPWGVRVAIAVDFGSPKTIGGLDTFDPLDARVAAWWKEKADELYRAVPDLAGIVLKADSEGRVGPSTYGRTHADAANVVARGLAAHGGVLFYRGFVYDHHMDWKNPKNDRGRAARDNQPLDGKFDANVIVQIKRADDFGVRSRHRRSLAR